MKHGEVSGNSRFLLDQWWLAALVCGAAPLIAGVSIFTAWVIRPRYELILAGMWTIGGGVVCVIIGLACLSRFMVRSVRRNNSSHRRLTWQCGAAIALLLVNFPVAGVLAYKAIDIATDIATQYVVTVTNDSRFALDSFIVQGGGVRVDFGTINPDTSISRTFYIHYDGELLYTGSRSGHPLQGTVDGYVTNEGGGDKAVIFHRDGSIQIVTRE